MEINFRYNNSNVFKIPFGQVSYYGIFTLIDHYQRLLKGVLSIFGQWVLNFSRKIDFRGLELVSLDKSGGVEV